MIKASFDKYRNIMCLLFNDQVNENFNFTVITEYNSKI